MRIDSELLAKYSGGVPRPASYPSAFDWDSGFAPAVYPKVLRVAAGKKAPISAHVHVPYRLEGYLFCGFNSALVFKSYLRGRAAPGNRGVETTLSKTF